MSLLSHRRFSRNYLFILLTAFLVLVMPACGGGGGGGDNGGNNPPPGGGNPPPAASNDPFWAQWGSNPAHSGQSSVVGQSFDQELADITIDPFVEAQQAELGGPLLSHYPVTLIDGDDFYVLVKSGTYPTCDPIGDWRNGANCGPNNWNQLTWNVARYHWTGDNASQIWLRSTSWKPPYNGATNQANQGLRGWEPVFHPILANSVLYAPASGGRVIKVNKTDGTIEETIDPFAGMGIDTADTFVSSPLAADADGNIYYNVVTLAGSEASNPWFGSDVEGAWLVKITPGDVTSVVSYADLVPGAPDAESTDCQGRFNTTQHALPWPPTTNATPPSALCGSQRPGINVTPAIAADGTIYTISRAHFSENTSYLVAVNPNMTLKWAASMQEIFEDGCGVLIPIAADTTTPNTCRPGTTVGVNPRTNRKGSARVTDLGSSSPVVLPDGSILYGAQTDYNGQRGHTVKFDSDGNFLDAYDFGWDVTPAVWEHDNTYSIILKDNHYGASFYCSGNALCQPTPTVFYITQLDADLQVEWKFQHTNDGGTEWCINAPMVDSDGVVYATAEDGVVYSIDQGTGTMTVPRDSRFLRLPLGAAYTPIAMAEDGRIYAQNDGHLFVLGD